MSFYKTNVNGIKFKVYFYKNGNEQGYKLLRPVSQITKELL